MRHNHKRRFNRDNRGNNRGFRTFKSFDPTNLIHNTNLISDSEIDDVESTQPEISFSDFDIATELKNAIAHRNFQTPTAIQAEAIPVIVQGRDVVGISNTGTGKTGAFLIPLINKVIKNRKSRVLIVAPTRELAVQIELELKLFTSKMHLYSAVCIGGVNIRRQINDLNRYPQFVIGTPGRLLDLANQRKIDFRKFDCVVLDEVDRMLDMGFIGDIRKIINQLPRERQSLFFSATLDSRTKSIMNDFLRNPVMVSISSSRAKLDIEQRTINANGRDKGMLLQDVLDEKSVSKTLIFVRTKRSVDKLSRRLNKVGFSTTVMHGNRSQNQRQRSLEEFRQGKVDILIATDVAARGIDVDDISHVINFDLPETQEDYIHRIGRTGRSGKKGVAISFIG